MVSTDMLEYQLEVPDMDKKRIKTAIDLLAWTTKKVRVSAIPEAVWHVLIERKRVAETLVQIQEGRGDVALEDFLNEVKDLF